MEEEYNVPVISSSVDKVGTDELQNMLKTALYEFPVVNVNVKIPKWIDILKNDNEITILEAYDFEDEYIYIAEKSKYFKNNCRTLQSKPIVRQLLIFYFLF